MTQWSTSTDGYGWAEFTPSERHSWGQGRKKERQSVIKDLRANGFAVAAQYLETGEIPMCGMDEKACKKAKIDRLIDAVTDLTHEVRQATAFRKELKGQPSVAQAKATRIANIIQQLNKELYGYEISNPQLTMGDIRIIRDTDPRLVSGSLAGRV